MNRGIQLCSKSSDLKHLLKIVQMLKSIRNPISFSMHVGKDIILNGVSIYSNLTSALNDYDQQNWEAFGKDLGSAFDLVFFGSHKLEKKQALLSYYNTTVDEAIIRGVL